MANVDIEIPVAPDTLHEAAGHPLSSADTAVAAAPAFSPEGATVNGLDTKGQDPQQPLSAGENPTSPLSINPPNPSSVPSSGHVFQPKRFSAVNINKKFLEKNSSAVGAIQTSSNSIPTKSGAGASRPPTQQPPTHSRLVTAKLTTAPQSSAGTGWSRPPSATPPVSSISSPVPGANAPAITSPASVSGAPQFPHAGKVIQPQPRSVTVSTSKVPPKEGTTSTKPAWGNPKSVTAANSIQVVTEQGDFPTAAEVAQVSISSKKAKSSEIKDATDTARSLYTQTRMEAADTFRGVHLDPNAHHWDEMSEDDDNFLEGIIEFGDGRQYTVQSVVQSSPPPPEPPTRGDDVCSNAGDGSINQLTAFVSKEERFADDFDRSWPRSKSSPTTLQQTSPVSGHQAPLPLPAPAHYIPSVQESSRVLFNERSNKLEPYGSNSHPPFRTNQGTFPTKKGSQSDTTPLTESSRSGFQSQTQGLQVLQKTVSGHPYDSASRPRGSTGSNSGATFHNDRPWGGEPFRREVLPTPFSQQGDTKRNRDNYNQFGPPSLPVRDRDNDMRVARRHHLSPTLPPGENRLSVHDTHNLTSSASANKEVGTSPGSSSSPLPAHSPITAQVPLASPSFASPGSTVGFPDLEEVRKDVMQSAAARAKERRKREEDEREKEKERARKKAAELEAKMRIAETEKHKPFHAEGVKATESIEDVQKNDEFPRQTTDPSAISTNTAPRKNSQPVAVGPRRPPSLKGLPRPAMDHTRQLLPRRLSQTSTGTPNSAQPANPQPDSWRSRANTVSAPVRSETALQPSSAFPEPPSVFPQDHVLSCDDVEEDLEVVDFSDLGKFVGDHDSSHVPMQMSSEIPTGSLSRTVRPVASNFFHDPPGNVEKADRAPWRRKEFDQDQQGSFVENASHTIEALSVSDSAEPEPSPASQSREVIVPDQHGGPYRYGVASNHSQQRTPRSSTFHKEADLSAWDDAMSRIKGALDGMQTIDPPKAQQHLVPDGELSEATLSHPPRMIKPTPPKEPRWIPPPLRVRHSDLDVQTHEELSLAIDPPQVPFVVRFPSVSRFLEQPSRKQLHLLKLPIHWRWDILSWDPPVEGMNRRELSLNEVLFRKPMNKGKQRYRVSLPRPRRTGKVPGVIGPRVHLPANTATISRSTAPGYHSRVSEADGVSTWRKPISPAMPRIEFPDDTTTNLVLDTVSRSPPPELSQDLVNTASLPTPGVSLVPKSETVLLRARSQPRMPAGSAVAFYRDSRIDTIDIDQDTGVNFIVSSELEGPSPPADDTTIVLPLLPSTKLLSGVESSRESKVQDSMVNGLKSQPPSPEYDVPALIQSNLESKSFESTDRIPMTPPAHHATTTWAAFSLKESPARAPDPEHLKAVWSQASDKAKLPAINSLEGIGDDLTALPFTLQDVKSEDGETPPPSVGPTRMTMHDVTRAFQQVPPSSSSTSIHRIPTVSSPSASFQPAPRQLTTYSYASPANAELRTNFSPYSSPMLSHAQAPAMIYQQPMPSHVPRIPVNNHTSVYNPQVWVTLAGPTAQNNGGMMRPVGSPYQAPMISYPPPNTPAGYGAPGSMPPPPPQANATRGRMQLMSPAVPHIAPHPNVAVYAGSPVLMHAPPVMQMAQSHTFIAGPPGRRTDPPGHPPLQQSPSHNSGYPFVRPPPW